MKYIIENNINIVEEVKNTLYFIVNEEKLINHLRDGLKEDNIDADKYINKSFKNYFKFIEGFKNKNKISMNRMKIFFKDISDENENSPCIASMLISNTTVDELILGRARILSLKEDYLRELTEMHILIEAELTEDYELQEVDEKKEFMSYLINKFTLREEDKWWLTVITQEPRKYLVELVDMLLESIEVFKETFKVMEKDVEKFIEELRMLVDGDSDFMSEITGMNILETSKSDIHVYPSFSRYNSVSLITNNEFIFNSERVEYMYFGWKFYELLELSRGKGSEMELLNSRLKCLSDKSKFNIIKMLKEKPMFGQEIATNLALTTATVSYHMNALILAKLVYMKKVDNKIFYSVDKDNMEEFFYILKKELI
ncbi:MAG: ArsR family transcriptional regulator [Peptostreptococcaceae bacterium]